jgi:hypothetical protein
LKSQTPPRTPHALPNLTGASRAGAAHLFRRLPDGTWSLLSSLAPPAALPAGSLFGEHCALSADGSTAAAATYEEAGTLSGEGAVYVFTAGTNGAYAFQQRLTAAVSQSGFGSALALSRNGSHLLAGATGENSRAGAVYAFARNSVGAWTQTSRVALSSSAGQIFGASLSLSADGSLAAVGAPGETVGDNEGAGAVYTLQRTSANWAQVARIPAPAPVAGAAFGSSLVLSDDALLLAAAADGLPREQINSTGVAYVFTRTLSNGALSAFSPLAAAATEAAGGVSSGRFEADDDRVALGFCWPLSLSGDGRSLLCGAPYGGAYIGGDDEGPLLTEAGWGQVFGPLRPAPQFELDIKFEEKPATVITGDNADATVEGRQTEVTVSATATIDGSCDEIPPESLENLQKAVYVRRVFFFLSV